MGRLADRITACKGDGRGALSIYLPVGWPDKASSVACMEAALEHGADWLEVGIPFSDPAADGPVIQAATAHALAAGTKVQDCFDAASALRRSHPDAPLIAMTYANILYRGGWDAQAARLAKAGFDGAIVPDIPLEESAPIREALADHGLEWSPLVTPTTPRERMQKIAATTTGFLYVVSNVGITGQGGPGPLVEETVRRAQAKCPVGVGFGIRTATDVQRVLAAGADAAIVGTAAVEAARSGPNAVATLVAALAEGTR